MQLVKIQITAKEAEQQLAAQPIKQISVSKKHYRKQLSAKEEASQKSNCFVHPNGSMSEVQEEVECSSRLPQLLALRKSLRERVAKPVCFAPPILTQKDEGIIWPHTIVLLQGQTGTHKSRVAELIASLFIADEGVTGHALGFECGGEKAQPCAVCYVDTERNLQEQFPHAIQKVQAKAGYEPTESPAHFEYTSLLPIPRTERLPALRDYLRHIRGSQTGHMVIILDQLADCVADFNDPKESMLLTDMLNCMVHEQDVTFVCIIHENPNSSKARGHLGTEMANKASTVLQLGFIKPANGEQGEVIQMKYIKRRTGAPNLKFHVRFDSEQQELVWADDETVKKAISLRKRCAPIGEVVAALSALLGAPMPATELKEALAAQLATDPKTIGLRLNEIISLSKPVPNGDGESCRLVKEKSKQNGRKLLYTLVPTP